MHGAIAYTIHTCTKHSVKLLFALLGEIQIVKIQKAQQSVFV